VKREYNEHTYKYTIPYIKFKYSYYTLGLSIGNTKDASKDSSEFARVVSLIIQVHSPRSRRECPSSVTLSLRVPIWNPTLIGLDFACASLIRISGKRKIITYIQQMHTRAKLEQLSSV
jgi:hypothetical protein